MVVIQIHKFTNSYLKLWQHTVHLPKQVKLRGQTPKVEGRKIVGDSSSVANKSNFKKRFALGRYPGQNKPGQRRKRR